MSKNNKQLDEKAIAEFKQQKRDVGYLISANMPADSHTTSWNGNDSNGNAESLDCIIMF